MRSVLDVIEEEGKIIGREEGRVEGREEAREKFARRLLASGMSPSKVANFAELSKKRVLHLKRELAPAKELGVIEGGETIGREEGKTIARDEEREKFAKRLLIYSTPPSRAAMRCSSTATVGLLMRL